MNEHGYILDKLAVYTLIWRKGAAPVAWCIRVAGCLGLTLCLLLLQKPTKCVLQLLRCNALASRSGRGSRVYTVCSGST